MQKLILFAIIITVNCTTDDRGVEPPTTKLVGIPDNAFRAYLKKTIPDAFSDGGDKMDRSLEAVKNLLKINVYKKQIKSLRGIEYFTGLKVLYCSNNPLEELDLTKNTALELLSCQHNQLITLDLSNNCKLKEDNVYADPSVKITWCKK